MLNQKFGDRTTSSVLHELFGDRGLGRGLEVVHPDTLEGHRHLRVRLFLLRESHSVRGSGTEGGLAENTSRHPLEFDIVAVLTRLEELTDDGLVGKQPDQFSLKIDRNGRRHVAPGRVRHSRERGGRIDTVDRGSITRRTAFDANIVPVHHEPVLAVVRLGGAGLALRLEAERTGPLRACLFVGSACLSRSNARVELRHLGSSLLQSLDRLGVVDAVVLLHQTVETASEFVPLLPQRTQIVHFRTPCMCRGRGTPQR